MKKKNFAFIACLASAFVLASCGAQPLTPEELSSAKAGISSAGATSSAPAASSEAGPSASSEAGPAASSEAGPAASSEAGPAASSEAEPAASSEAEPEVSSSEAEPEVSSSVEPVATGYVVTFGTADHALAENPTPDTETWPGLLHEYYATGLSVTAGQSIVFSYQGEALTSIGSDPQSATSINNINESSAPFTVHNDATNVGVYLKVYSSGYSFWITGHEAGQEGSSSSSAPQSQGVGFYVRGTSVGGWDAVAAHELVASSDSNNAGEIKGVTFTVGEFKIANADWSQSWGWSYKNKDESEDHLVVQGGAKANFSKGEGGNIKCDTAGTYDLYLTTNNYIFIEVHG